jgi:hypothetical protein
MKTKLHYLYLVDDILDITTDVEGSGLAREVDRVLDRYADYLESTPIPSSVATWLDDLIDLMNNVEGSGLERELKRLKAPC